MVCESLNWAARVRKRIRKYYSPFHRDFFSLRTLTSLWSWRLQETLLVLFSASSSLIPSHVEQQQLSECVGLLLTESLWSKYLPIPGTHTPLHLEVVSCFGFLLVWLVQLTSIRSVIHQTETLLLTYLQNKFRSWARPLFFSWLDVVLFSVADEQVTDINGCEYAQVAN